MNGIVTQSQTYQMTSTSIPVLVPETYYQLHLFVDAYVLNQLCRQGVVLKTPSRKSSRGNIASYEDRFVLKLASMDDAIVVSNDKFRDLQTENAKFRETIEKRILPFVFANDQ